MLSAFEMEYTQILSTRTKLSPYDVLMWMNHWDLMDEDGEILNRTTGQHWFSAEEAIQLGIATAYCDCNL